MADSPTLFCLLETAAGYGLFEAVGWDEIGQESADELERFSRAVKLTSFQPFENAVEALENANAISEHALSPTLSKFLELQLPISTKKKKKTSSFALGVIDPALATAIADGLNVTCRSDDTVREILRGCRLHLPHYVKSLGNSQAQLGLGHAYSRSKVKFNPARSDNMIIQSIALLDTLDKDINTFAMRIREWYSWHFPELKEIVKDNIQFARMAACIQDKGTAGSKIDQIREILGDDEDNQAQVIVEAAKTSMGMDCSAVDMMNICNFTQRMVKLAEYRKKLSLYLTEKIGVVAPNLSALIGDTVAARLISKAGSLTNLAKAPASTVQILGAEKALFRALKTKGNTPKYGLLYHSTFIGRADAKNKGRISRYLANKCSIATRIDSFSDAPNRLYGTKLREQVEERLAFYETGAAPRKNVDVMAQVAKELAQESDTVPMDVEDDDAKIKKDKKKKKKRSADEAALETADEPKESAKDEEEIADADKETRKSAKKAKKEKKKKKKKSKEN